MLIRIATTNSRRRGAQNYDGDVAASCVDTRSARRAIHVRLFEQYSNCGYWLDLGNQEATANGVSDSRPTRMGASCGGVRHDCHASRSFSPNFSTRRFLTTQ